MEFLIIVMGNVILKDLKKNKFNIFIEDINLNFSSYKRRITNFKIKIVAKSYFADNLNLTAKFCLFLRINM